MRSDPFLFRCYLSWIPFSFVLWFVIKGAFHRMLLNLGASWEEKEPDGNGKTCTQTRWLQTVLSSRAIEIVLSGPFSLAERTYQKLKVQKLKLAWFTLLRDWNVKRKQIGKVPPRFELGSLDSESRVLTITPWNRSYCWLDTLSIWYLFLCAPSLPPPLRYSWFIMLVSGTQHSDPKFL